MRESPHPCLPPHVAKTTAGRLGPFAMEGMTPDQSSIELLIEAPFDSRKNCYGLQQTMIHMHCCRALFFYHSSGPNASFVPPGLFYPKFIRIRPNVCLVETISNVVKRFDSIVRKIFYSNMAPSTNLLGQYN